MAEPLAILGALAAASQLASQCLKLTLFFSSIRSQIRDSREFIDTSMQQVQQLTSILHQIISNPALQTNTMAAVLQACLSEAEGFYGVLRGMRVEERDGRVRRFRKRFLVLRRQKVMEARVESLERLKGLLALCVAEINASNTHDASASLQTSMAKSNALLNHTSSGVGALINSVPRILTQLAAIEEGVCRLSGQMETHSAETVASARFIEDFQYFVQHLKIRQPNTIRYSRFGSNIVTHYLVPGWRHKLYAGFDDTISKMERLYSLEYTPPTRVLTLTGAACGGKTRAAWELCHRAQNTQQFGAIFWVKASSATAIEKSFKIIADSLNIPPALPVQRRIETTINILRAWPCRWLMVLDNYNGPDPAKDLGVCMPDSEQGSHLITRKMQHLTPAEQCSAIQLPDLQLQDAIELLLNRSGVERTDDNYEQALRLVRVLDKIPRAVMSAGKYVKKHKIGFAEYMRRLGY